MPETAVIQKLEDAMGSVVWERARLRSNQNVWGSLGLLLLAAGCSATPTVGDGEGVGTAQQEVLGPPSANFSGISTFSAPPDTIGEVGPNHYVQAVNATQFGVWNKSGTLIAGPVSLGSLWPAGRCSNNLGDPTVNYDQLADRWVLQQFAQDGTGAALCVAVSRTAVPGITGADYFLYDIGTPVFPDYPKIGVWPDGYYITTYEGANLGLYVLDRAALLAGTAPATFNCAATGSQCLVSSIPSLGAPGVRDTRILPVDLEGPTPPAVGTPGIFVRTVDSQQDPNNPTDRIEVYTATVNWTTQSWAIGGPAILAPNAFDTMLCNRNGLGFRDCIPEPGGATNSVDALSNRPMMGLKYRQFAGRGSLVFNQTVNVAGLFPGIATGEVAGIRWYELRSSGAGWTIFDQGDFAPQNSPGDNSELIHRWMGSASLDRDGNIAVGYSLVNSDNDPGEELFPAIAYAGRLTTDAPGTLGSETLVAESASALPGSGNRWGDYSAMSVDPADDCTFWFTTHLASGDTRIVSFKHNECGGICSPTTYQAETMFHSVGSAAPPDGWNLHSNGYISTTHNFTAGPATVTVRALGQSAAGVAPHMIVRVGSTVIGDVYVSQTSYTNFSFTFTASAGPQEIRITFDNDLYQPPQDRNLWLDRVTVECAPSVPASPCAGLCQNPTSFNWGGATYQSGNLGTGAICRETTHPVAGGNCGNFAAGRQFLVNGTPQVCNGANWAAVPPTRNGGYCIQANAGNWAWAFYTLW
jgi:hypothetical protein